MKDKMANGSDIQLPCGLLMGLKVKKIKTATVAGQQNKLAIGSTGAGTAAQDHL